MRKTAKMKIRSRVVVVGSVNTDMMVQVDHLPQPGETVLGGQFITAHGGKGANQAVAAARLGCPVSFIGRVGHDAFGDQAIAALRKEQVDVDHVGRDRRARSGVALILVSERGENSIAVASGANGELLPTHVKRAARAFASDAILLAQLETPLESVIAAVELARRAGMPVILNPAPAKALPDSLLKKISVLTPNETEAEQLTGISTRTEAGVIKAAEALRARGAPTVIVTLGARGALVSFGETCERYPAFKANAIDTTAAGDVFNGALAVALAEGRTLRNAVFFANAAAAISVTRLGAQSSAPKRREVDRLLKGVRR